MSGRFAAAGVGEPAEIRIDRWGIPHIRAASLRDALFAQGFSAARDRLWQMDLWRRAGLGRLAEVLGPSYVERDRAARLFLYRGSMQEEWQAYGCDLRQMLSPFVDGINEYVRLLAQRPQLLPPEFELLRYAPAEWSAEDVLSIRGHGRYRNLRSEVARAQILHRFGPSAERLRVRLEPQTEIAVPEGLDLSLIDAEVLRAYDNATTPPFAQAGAGGPAGDGSNNWVLAGSRTATGRPVLAGDPHRALSLPSLRCLAQVACPELNVIGGGEPMLPGVSFGHNGRIAFGFTILPIDQEDLYVYEVDGAGCRYRYGSGWEAMSVERERIEVRDGDPVEVELRFTRHGPVVHELPERGAAFAVRAAWLQPGMVPYLGSLALLQAENWKQFRAAAKHWGGPGENLVYADVDGNIGYQATGRVPIRASGDGSLPASGADNAHEWTGFVPFDKLPSVFNPPSGILATANGRITPDKYPFSLSVEWGPPYRTARIYKVLQSGKKFAPADMLALQTDVYSTFDHFCADRFVYALDHVKGISPRQREARELMRKWDGRMLADSAAAAVEASAREELYRLLLEPKLGAVSSDSKDDGQLSWKTYEWFMRPVWLENVLLYQPQRWLPSQFHNYNELLAAAVESAIQRPGVPSQLADWRWGDLNPVEINHPIFGAVPILRHWAGPGWHPQSGDSYTVKAVGRHFGPSERTTVDLADLDNSTLNIVTGQSGNLFSPYYMDQWPAWFGGATFRLPFSAPAVAASRMHQLVLQPAK